MKGISVAYAAIGGLILYSGIKGATLSDTASMLLSGNLTLKNDEPITADNSSTTPAAASGSTSDIVADAMKYNGEKYVWGGTPGTTKGHNNGTDCSGFVNMVVGRDLGHAIPSFPAGKYTGAVHGPVTQEWMIWDGAQSISISQVQPGDLACFLTHIGIFVDGGQHFISALDTQSGVVVTTVAGGSPTGESVHPRRLL